MRNFHKFGKANISAAEMERERERIRKKMESTRSGMMKEPAKPKKEYKPSDFKLGEYGRAVLPVFPAFSASLV